MSLVNQNVIAGASGNQGYTIDRSVRLRSSASAYFNRTFGTPTSGTTWTWSGWVKRGKVSSGYQRFFGHLYVSSPTNNQHYVGFNSDDTLEFEMYTTSAYNARLVTTQVFRDPSAWYHIVAVWNTSDATSSNRLKLYVNGQQITSFSTATYPSQNQTGFINQNGTGVGIGVDYPYNNSFFDGYLTEVNFIDGQALDPTSFGETDAITGVWKAKKYVGTYGTNGFYLNFSDNTSTNTLGYDYSGNSNNWTANNISLTAGATYDSMTDVPTLTSETAANYCTLNPLNKAPSDVSISSGNLEASSSFTSDHRCFASTFQITSGKWYWEVQYATGTISIGSNIVGVFNLSTPDTANNRRPADSINNGIGIRQDGQYESDNTSAAYFGSSISVGDVIGVALDADAGTVKFNVNGGSFGSTLTFVSAGGVYTPGGDIRASSGTPKTIHNFGQRPFAYTPPTGFKALNTFNLPDSTIVAGNKYFDATTFTANGTTQVVNNSGFQPDFLWFKRRDVASNHFAFNSVVGDDSYLVPNLTDAEGSAPNFLSSLNSNGFTMGTGQYANGSSVVCWNWKAGGTAVSNTDGTITSSVSANTTSGFSIVTYTGTGANATVGHGLGVAPSMVIVKDRDTAGNNWFVWHTALTGLEYLILNLTNAKGSASAKWNSTIPSSTVFSVGTDSEVNGLNHKNVAYCFADVPGFSKFGSYTGNGSSDGSFVFCGFRPAFVLYKNANYAGTSWAILDSSRNAYNVENARLFADSSSAEDTSVSPMDFTSNGFKVRSTNDGVNRNGDTIIYAAFAENPFKNSLAR